MALDILHQIEYVLETVNSFGCQRDVSIAQTEIPPPTIQKSNPEWAHRRLAHPNDVRGLCL